MAKKLGIDVSTHQGKIDWQKVKNSCIDFAMLRCGYGRSAGQKDAQFERNYKQAKKYGVPVGAYHYSYATSIEGAKAEAKYCLSLIKGKQFEYPIAFDIEDKTQRDLGVELISDIIRAFCEVLENAGYYVVVYANKDWLDNRIDEDCKKRYDVWLAQWTKKPTYSGAFGLWQYSDSGKVDGISGNVDMNIAYKDYPAIMVANGLNGYVKKVTNKTEKPVAKPVEKPAAKPVVKSYKKGDKVELKNAYYYRTAYDKKARGKKSGTFYLYDGVKVNGRYRITNKPKNCGRKPMALFVTAWVVL